MRWMADMDRYPIPNDDAEQNRDDMKHAMMLELTKYEQLIGLRGDQDTDVHFKWQLVLLAHRGQPPEDY